MCHSTRNDVCRWLHERREVDPPGGMKRIKKDLTARMERIKWTNQKTCIINKLAT
jgi:hypothetical protein